MLIAFSAEPTPRPEYPTAGRGVWFIGAVCVPRAEVKYTWVWDKSLAEILDRMADPRNAEDLGKARAREVTVGFRDNLDADAVTDLHLRDAIVVPPGTSVRETARQMRAKRLGCAFVTDESGRPRSIFTERLLVGLLARNVNLDDPVSQHATSSCCVISESAPIAELVRLMESHDVRYVGVADSSGRLTGLTGQRGLMEYVAEYFPRQVMVARTGMKSTQREGA